MTHASNLVAASVATSAQMAFASDAPIHYCERPFCLIEKMADSPLKQKLLSCQNQESTRSKFSIGHRGAPLMFPEHTVESNAAAARKGAGILECEVTFTADKELVCCHAQNDLHTTTDMVVSSLSDKCIKPFASASGDN